MLYISSHSESIRMYLLIICNIEEIPETQRLLENIITSYYVK
jgi:hypothetical protein